STPTTSSALAVLFAADVDMTTNVGLVSAETGVCVSWDARRTISIVLRLNSGWCRWTSSGLVIFLPSKLPSVFSPPKPCSGSPSDIIYFSTYELVGIFIIKRIRHYFVFLGLFLPTENSSPAIEYKLPFLRFLYNDKNPPPTITNNIR